MGQWASSQVPGVGSSRRDAIQCAQPLHHGARRQAPRSPVPSLPGQRTRPAPAAGAVVAYRWQPVSSGMSEMRVHCSTKGLPGSEARRGSSPLRHGRHLTERPQCRQRGRETVLQAATAAPVHAPAGRLNLHGLTPACASALRGPDRASPATLCSGLHTRKHGLAGASHPRGRARRSDLQPGHRRADGALLCDPAD